MDFSKFNFYKTDKYTELSTKLIELKSQLRTYILTLKNSDNKVIDKVQLSQLEYDKSGNKYFNYYCSVETNEDIEVKVKNIENQINEYRNEYNNTIKDILFRDIADELSIDFEVVYTIVKVVLNRGIYIRYFSNLSEIGDEGPDIEFVNFEQFYSNDYSTCEFDKIAQLILELIKNELLLLKLKI